MLAVARGLRSLQSYSPNHTARRKAGGPALHMRGDKAGGGAATGGDKPPRTKISSGPSEGADSGGVSGVDGARLSGAGRDGGAVR